MTAVLRRRYRMIASFVDELTCIAAAAAARLSVFHGSNTAEHLPPPWTNPLAPLQ